MDSQASNLSLILSEQTFEYLQDQLPNSWSKYVESQELTALKPKDLNNICCSDEQDKIAHLVQKDEEHFLNTGALDLSRKKFCVLELVSITQKENEEKGNVDYLSSERIIGRFNFDVVFKEAHRVTKSISYTYSEKLKTLFVRPQLLCNVVISVCGDIPQNTKLFITPMFLSSNHAKEPVQACPNHLGPNDGTSRHLIRVDLEGAHYGTHQNSKHHFVCIDYHALARDRNEFSVPLKFQCFSTCLGGIGKRPFQVIYWLQNGAEVLGRKSVKTQVCSCPGRDKLAKETFKFGSSGTPNGPLMKELSPKRRPSRTIKTQDDTEYSILMKVVTHLREHSVTSCGCKQFFLSLCEGC